VSVCGRYDAIARFLTLFTRIVGLLSFFVERRRRSRKHACSFHARLTRPDRSSYWCLSSSALSWRVKSSFASVSSQSSSHCLTSSASSSSAPHSVGRRRSRVGVGQKGGGMRRTRRDLGDGPGRDLDARGNSRRTFVAELLELVVALQVDGDVLRLLLLLLGHGGFASDAHTEVAGRPRFFGETADFRNRGKRDSTVVDVSSVSDVTSLGRVKRGTRGVSAIARRAAGTFHGPRRARRGGAPRLGPRHRSEPGVAPRGTFASRRGREPERL
jgi:hypothetical protein